MEPPVELLSDWAISGVVSVSLPDTGSMNDTWLIEHESGRHVLRRHRRTKRADVELEHTVLEWVRDEGVPVPEVLPLLSGDSVLEIDGSLYTVYSWARGVQLSRDAIDLNQATAMGLTLAHIHEALADKPFQPSLTPAPAGEDRTLARIQDVCDAIRGRSDAQAHAGALDHLLSRAFWLESTPPAPPPEPRDAAQLIHGDYQHTNLFFADDRVSSVIDWDKARPESPSLEIVRGLHYGLGMEPSRCAAFIEGYRRRRAISAETLHTASRIWNHHDAHGLWAFEQTYLRNDPRALRRFKPEPFVPFIDRWNRLEVD